MYRIDLNSDLGESFGRYTLGLDDQIIPLVSSANVACGQHAGDPMVMRDTVRMAADAGIAISTGAAIAREIADITVASEDLFELVTLRKLSEALMDRIHGSYRFIVAFNLSLITLGVAGVLPPAISALLHNTSTLGIGLKNMTDLLEEHEGA